MKIKSILATGLTLGILTSSASLFVEHDANAATKQHHQVQTQKVPYTTTIDGSTSYVQSYLKLSNQNANNFYQLNNKVKDVLKKEYKVSASQIEKAHTAQYVVTWKNGKKQTVNLKNNAYLPTNKFNSNQIKQIDIVLNKKAVKQKDKRVPYSVTINGSTSYVQSYFKVSNQTVHNFYQLNNQVKTTLQKEYHVSKSQIEKAQTAKYVVTWNNGKKQTVNLKQTSSLTTNYFNSSQIKQIDITFKKQPQQQTEKHVPYSVTVNGATSYVQSYFKVSDKTIHNFYQLSNKVKDALRNEYHLSQFDLDRSNQAQYVVTWENGKKQTVDLKSTSPQLTNQISGSDIKNIEILVENVK